MVVRSLKISLDFGNTGKKEDLDLLWEAYRETMKDFLNRLFSGEGLSENFLKAYESPLSYRYKQCARRQALKIFKCWCRGKKKKNKPELRNPSMTLDYRFVEVQESNNSFDFWIKIATLDKGNPILIPAESYDYLNNYLESWDLLNGGRLVKQNDKWFLILIFQKEAPEKRSEGKTIGVDIGYRKLITDSEDNKFGTEIKPLIDKADRKKQFSKGYYKVKSEIKNYINRELNKVISPDLKIVVLEDLKDLKKNKRGIRSKAVNRKFSFWIYSHVLTRISQLCEVAGVQCHKVDPAYTSQECPNPDCGHIEKGNRKEEKFKCLRCGFEADADHVGALNILSRFLGKSIVSQVG